MCIYVTSHPIYTGIGNTGDIVPVDYTQVDLGNLVSCILSSGVLILDTYFNLSQREIRKMDIPSIQMYFELAHFKLQHLFCWRQRLFDCNRPNTLALKPHACCHLSRMISFFGPPANNDTVTFEHMHINNVKKAVNATSKRSSSDLQEMNSRIQFQHLARALRTTNLEGRKPKKQSGFRSISYETNSNLIYEASLSEAFRDKVTYVNESTFLLNQRFLNPNVSMCTVWAALKRSDDEEIINFLNEHEQNTPGGPYSTYTPCHNSTIAKCIFNYVTLRQECVPA